MGLSRSSISTANSGCRTIIRLQRVMTSMKNRKLTYTQADTILSVDVARRDITPGDLIGAPCFYGFSPIDALEAAKQGLGYRRGLVTAASDKGFIVDLGRHGSAVSHCIVPVKDRNPVPLRLRSMWRNLGFN